MILHTSPVGKTAQSDGGARSRATSDARCGKTKPHPGLEAPTRDNGGARDARPQRW